MIETPPDLVFERCPDKDCPHCEVKMLWRNLYYMFECPQCEKFYEAPQPDLWD